MVQRSSFGSGGRELEADVGWGLAWWEGILLAMAGIVGSVVIGL